MKKPDDIPQDAWDEVDVWANWYVADPLRTVEEAIARAILAAKAEEREACALVADDYHNKTPNRSLRMGAGWIADDIRKRGEP